jgi:hypothetical protein
MLTMFDYIVIKRTFLRTHAYYFRRGSSFNYNQQKTDFGNIRIYSKDHCRILTLLLFPYTENHKPSGIYTDVKTCALFSSAACFLINIQRISLEMCTERHVGLHAKGQ